MSLRNIIFYLLFCLLTAIQMSHDSDGQQCRSILSHCRLVWNMNAEKWHHSEIRIAINEELQDSIAKNLRCDELLYYAFITESVGERISKIGEHLAKLRAKSLTVSYTPFALHFCPQRGRSRQISWITCVLQTETVIKRCYVNRQINVS